jgi:hypothetical protein
MEDHSSFPSRRSPQYFLASFQGLPEVNCYSTVIGRCPDAGSVPWKAVADTVPPLRLVAQVTQSDTHASCNLLSNGFLMDQSIWWATSTERSQP